MKIWVTKYALTAGIQSYEAETGVSDDMACVRINGRMAQYFHGNGREWHTTLESAIAHAEVMRVKKIASLEKSIKKMQKLSFTGDAS